MLPFQAAVAETEPAPLVEASSPDGNPWVDATRFTGLTSDTAAASCWEIKQLHPDSPSGAYWLLTPAMTEPAQFWCDQETDGGGWVKVGQGRQDWETTALGRGSAARLLTPTPAADSGTHQLSTRTVDALLDGTDVNDLADGIRVRRAANIDGTAWQEVRFTPVKDSGWSWAMGALWPVASWTVGGSSGTGGTTATFGSGSSDGIVNTLEGSSSLQFTWSFSYGGGVTGSDAASSYLWTPTAGQGSARPFSQVYIRPRLLNSDLSFTRIPDEGSSKIELESVPESNALRNPWGVTGIAGAYEREGDIEVQDMVAIGSTMYVAGNFRYVQRDQGGTGRVEQPFLAAFDASSGEFISTFRPVINEAVLAVAPAAGGRLAIGGKFTSVNGTAVTGLAVLDPNTGALSGPQATLTNGISPGVVRIETISSAGGDLYLGGSFTHTTGPSGSARYTRNVSRVDATTMMPVTGWFPEFNGTVLDSDVAADGSKAYFSGFFGVVDGQSALRVAAMPTSTPVSLDAWTPTWSSDNKNYQRAIAVRGDRVYVGGSEHSMFAYDTTTYERVVTHVTNPKGDFQTLNIAGDFLIGGSHSNWFIYKGATHWPSIGSAWTDANPISWVNAWRLSDVTSVATFSPAIRSRMGAGGWASAVAPDGTIWAGGDFTGARGPNGGGSWTGAFVRYGLTDGTAPEVPANLRVASTGTGSVNLAWNAPAGGVGSGGGYQIIRDDRVIASTSATNATVPLAGEQRYFVRAVDRTGNVSASTPVLTVPGGNPVPTAQIQHTIDGLTVAFDASSSTDDGSIVAYRWNLGDGTESSDPAVTHSYLSGGTYEIQLDVLDDQGGIGSATYELDLAQPRPADAYGAQVFDDTPWAYWRLDETSGDIAADTSPEGHHATYQQGVSQGTDGVVEGNTAAHFDGIDDVVVSKDSIAGPNTYSTEAWFRTTTDRGGKIIGFGNAASGLSSSYDRHVYMQNDGRLVFGIYSGAEYKITSTTAFNDGVWHHVVATQSSSGMTLYVDGAAAGTNPQAVAEATSGHWRVGGDRTWGSSSAYFQGDIDEAAVYSSALTAEQVLAHYRDGLQQDPPVVSDLYAQTVLGDSPSMYWRLDAARYGIIQDASAQGATGIVVDSPSVGSDSGVTDGFASMSFDGVDDGVASAAAQPAPTSYSTEVWFKTTTTSGGKLVGFGDERTGESSDYDRHLYMLADGKLVTGVWARGATTVTTTDGYNDGEWHYAVAQLSGGILSLYVDGQLIDSVTLSTDAQVYDGYWRLGGDTQWVGSSEYFAGSLDEFAVYPQALSEAQIAAHYAAGTAAPNQPPVADFTAVSTDLVVDVDASTSHDADGSITGYSWNFGDGTPAASGATASHTYASAGDYTVELTVTDDRGGTSTESHVVTATDPPNQLPQALIDASPVYLTVSVDGTGSTDSDGTIVGYSWDFGDGTSPSTDATASHTYANAGTYTIMLTVTDDRTGTATAMKTVTVEAQPSGEVVPADASWQYYYGVQAPDAGWTTVSFDDSAWASGVGPIGYGSATIVTDIAPAPDNSDRPRAVNFRTDFTVADASNVESLELTSVADDGVVIYVNGTEVVRSNMPTGVITHDSFALAPAPRTAGANANPVVVQVPVGLLVSGQNVIAAETHVNYRGTPDVSFTLTAMLGITGSDAPATGTNQPPVAAVAATVDGLGVTASGAGSSDPDGTITDYDWDFGDGGQATGAAVSHTYAAAGDYTLTLTVSDDDGASATATKTVTVADISAGTTAEVVAEGASWRYYYDLAAPDAGWSGAAFDASAWATGVGPIGYGSATIATDITPAPDNSDRPRAVYFRTGFDVADAGKVLALELTGVADDGVVIYVNGTEVVRSNMPTGVITHDSFALAPAPRTAGANANPVIVRVPIGLLVTGQNVIAAETHVNYRGTPDLSFKLKAMLTVAS